VWRPAPLGVVAHAIQQHGLAHAAQPDHQHALGMPPGPDALDGDVDGAQEFVTAGKFRGRRSGAWRKGWRRDPWRQPYVEII